ncbi:MAG: cytochrome c peroxidase [Rhodobacter sp.]|nr:cytochrome c peroxidase [Rhodobacter sp.]
MPEPLTDADFIRFDPGQAQLGQLLFYDKILSGNQNISCGTCHHHDLGSSDGLSLGIGEGGVGLGPERTAGTGPERIRKRIPRNAPSLWNLAHKDVDTLFHDGRLSVSDLYGNGFNSPAEEWLPQGLKSVLAAQALFPMTSDHEMAGHPGENEIAGAVKERIDLAWPIIAKRVRGVPEYGRLFVDAFDHIEAPEEVTIVEIGNAIAAFIGTEFRNHDSAFDAYLQGDAAALNAQQTRGMELFYSVGCSGCHAGPLMTDNGFHAIGLPQFGPGRTRKWDPVPRDVGRMGETDRLEDAYKFRTPSLRNVALTAPYGHNGAMPTLEAMVRHHADPMKSQEDWQPAMANLRPAPWIAQTDFIIREDRIEMARQLAVNELDLPPLTDRDIADIVAFLHCLTGRSAGDRPLGVPDTVPSGLPVD